jgi:hypothetical protein
MKSEWKNVVPISVFHKNVYLTISKSGGCQSCKNSNMHVTEKTKPVIARGCIFLKKRKIIRHQNSTYKIPDRELFTQCDAGPR